MAPISGQLALGLTDADVDALTACERSDDRWPIDLDKLPAGYDERLL